MRVIVSDAASPRRLAVLGSPIHHSRSPRIHRAAYATLNLNWHYEAIELIESDFDGFFQSLDPSWLGFSVTMPLKRKAFDLAATQDEPSRAVEVVNTLLRTDGQWAGFNTDVPGIEACVSQLSMPSMQSAVILGAGATAKSAAYALMSMGFIDVTIVARRLEQAVTLCQQLSELPEAHGKRLATAPLPNGSSAKSLDDDFSMLLGDADLLVNTLPGDISGSLTFENEAIHRAALFDINYDPWPSPLCMLWASQNRAHVDGLELLVRQALVQVRIFVNGSASAPLPDEVAVLETMRQSSVER